MVKKVISMSHVDTHQSTSSIILHYHVSNYIFFFLYLYHMCYPAFIHPWSCNSFNYKQLYKSYFYNKKKIDNNLNFFFLDFFELLMPLNYMVNYAQLMVNEYNKVLLSFSNPSCHLFSSSFSYQRGDLGSLLTQKSPL